MGAMPCSCWVLSLDPKPASRGLDKSHLLGASPVFFHPSGGSPGRMEKQGDLHIQVNETEEGVGFLLLGQLLVPQSQGCEPHGGRGPLMVGCTGHSGVKR